MRIYQQADKIRRYWRQFRILIIRDGWKKAAYMKRHSIFYHIGENVYYTSNILPAEPFLVCLHNNIVISAGVRLITHDVSHVIFNIEEKSNRFYCKYGKVEICDNVYVGANAIINYGVTIESNCIIAAGAVVTHDVPSGSVVAGVPARVIGSYEDVKKRAEAYSQQYGEMKDRRWVVDLLKVNPVHFRLDDDT